YGKRLLRCGISIRSMSDSGHPRLRRGKPRHGACPLHSESDHLVIIMRSVAMCHKRTSALQQKKAQLFDYLVSAGEQSAAIAPAIIDYSVDKPGDTDRPLSAHTQNTKDSIANSFTATVASVPAATSGSTANRGRSVHWRPILAMPFTRAIELVTQNTSGSTLCRASTRSICCRNPNDGSVKTNGNSTSSRRIPGDGNCMMRSSRAMYVICKA